jgi:hypothetical protein
MRTLVGPARLRGELPEPRAYNSAQHEIIELMRSRQLDKTKSFQRLDAAIRD